MKRWAVKKLVTAAAKPVPLDPGPESLGRRHRSQADRDRRNLSQCFPQVRKPEGLKSPWVGVFLIHIRFSGRRAAPEPAKGFTLDIPMAIPVKARGASEGNCDWPWLSLRAFRPRGNENKILVVRH